MKRLMYSLLISVICMSNLQSQESLFRNVGEDASVICPILIGETLPNAILQTAEGKIVELSTLLSQKPTVLVFYRGGWCPYCNRQLAGLAEIETEVLNLGYQIIAVSPDDYQNLQTTEKKDQLSYTLLSDPKAKLIREIGIGFKTPDNLRGLINSKEDQKGETSEVLPVPTVLVLDTSGNILFEYINPDYKTRLSGKMLLAVLKNV